MNNYPAGVTDNDSYFDDGGRRRGKHAKTEPPKTTMVYCPEGAHHWEAPATEDNWWAARSETCAEHIPVRPAGCSPIFIHGVDCGCEEKL